MSHIEGKKTKEEYFRDKALDSENDWLGSVMVMSGIMIALLSNFIQNKIAFIAILFWISVVFVATTLFFLKIVGYRFFSNIMKKGLQNNEGRKDVVQRIVRVILFSKKLYMIIIFSCFFIGTILTLLTFFIIAKTL